MTVGVCFLTPRTKSEVLCAALNRKFQGPVDFEKRKSPRAPLALTHTQQQPVQDWFDLPPPAQHPGLKDHGHLCGEGRERGSLGWDECPSRYHCRDTINILRHGGERTTR